MDYRKRAKEIKNALDTLLSTAKAENRAFTAEEQTSYTAQDAEFSNCLKMIEVEDKQKQRDADQSTPVNEPAVSNVRVTANPPKWENAGEFLGAVAKAAGADRQIDNRLLDIKNQSGLNEGVGSEGGFLVETDHSSELLKRTYELGALASRIRKVGISANANGLTINGVNENSRATGSRWGGVQGYWLHEAGTKTPSMPSFKQIELKLKKLIGLCYATDELLQDSNALGQIINQAFSEEFAWLIDNAILRGTGVGQPQGILNSPSLVTVPAEPGQAAGTIVFENIVKMYSRMWARSRPNSVWFINQDAEPELHTMGMVVGVGGVPVYMPAGGVSGSPYATLYGRPVIPIEQCSTVGTVGDIVLADLSQYLGIDKGGMQAASSIHVRFVNDEQCFRFVYRMDGQSMWNAALTPANGTNTLAPWVALATR
jgi:HK97 family phage major capsid protein